MAALFASNSEAEGGMPSAFSANGNGAAARRPRKLSTAVARDVMVGAALVSLVCCALFAAVFYTAVDRQLSDELAAECESLAEVLNAHSGVASMSEVIEGQAIIARPETRVTLVAHDGTVTFDSEADAAQLGNHAMRPEIEQALATGVGASGRYSETLQEETRYHAVLLEDGSVLRLAQMQASVVGVMSAMVVPALVVLLASFAVSALVGALVGRRISATIAGIDLDNPQAAAAPAEMEPLLARLAAQRKRIAAQAAERRRFTANVSHELKTPLTVVSGYAELIENGIAKPEDVAHCAGLIHSEAQHMRTMVDDLLALSRMDDMAAADARPAMDEQVSLSKLAYTIADRLRPVAQARAMELYVNVAEGDDMCVSGNYRMLEEMMRNLVENAIRYNSEGAPVHIAVRRLASGQEQISVADCGQGIAPELREKVFERFFCVDESRSKETGGSGLGLAIVKHAAQLHGAAVAIQDNAPQGSIFEVTFPLR